MTGLVAAVTALAVYRVTMLVTGDEITRPARERAETWLHPRAPRAAVALSCPWCVSVWVAPPVVASALWWADGWGWWLAAGALAASAVTGIIATWAAP